MNTTSPKMMRETLARIVADHETDRNRIAAMVRAIDEVRPLDSAGRHGDLHTDACGCEGYDGPWTIALPGAAR